MRPLSGKRVGSMQCKVIGIRLRKFSTKICLRFLQASHRHLLSLQLPHFLDLPDKHKRKSYGCRLNPTLCPTRLYIRLKQAAIGIIFQVLRSAQNLQRCARLSSCYELSLCAPEPHLQRCVGFRNGTF